MTRFKDSIEQHPVIVTLASLLIGFTAGIGAYQGILSIAKLDTVQKGSYIKSSDVVGNLLRNEALREIEHLIELGEGLDADDDSTEIESYMVRAHTFVHYLDLPKHDEIAGTEYSFAEQRIDHIIRDMPNTGDPPAPLDQKVSRIVGVLHGLKASLSSLQK